MASLTVYPDADPENTSVDGTVREYSAAGVDWATLIAGVGNYSYDDGITGWVSYFIAVSTTDRWGSLFRGILLFDTSALPDAATITAATLSIWGSAKYDDASNSPNINVYESAPASNTALEPGDFDSLSATALCDTPISYSDFSTIAYNNFDLNATGISLISKTGITKLGLRNVNYDIDGVTPAWQANALTGFNIRLAENLSGNPKLVITYTEPPSFVPKVMIID